MIIREREREKVERLRERKTDREIEKERSRHMYAGRTSVIGRVSNKKMHPKKRKKAD